MVKTSLKIGSFLLLGMVVLVLTVAGFILTSYDNDDYRQGLTELVSTFTDYTLTVDGSFRVNVSLTPSVSASSVSLTSEKDDAVFTFDQLKCQLALYPLLKGMFHIIRLEIDGGEVIWTAHEEEIEEDALWNPNRIEPLINLIPDRVTLRNISITVKQEKNDRIIRVFLDNLTISDILHHNPLSFSGQGSVADTPFSLSGNMGVLTALAGHDEPYPVKLKVHSQPVTLSLKGNIADITTRRGAKFFVKADIADVASVFKFFKLPVPLVGRLQAEGRLMGNLNSLALRGAKLSIGDEKLTDLKMICSIDDIFAMQGIYTNISGTLADRKMLEWLLPKELYAISNVTFSTSLTSEDDGYLISNANVRGTNSQGLQVDLQGHGLLDNFSANQPFGELDVLIHIDSPNTAGVQGYLPGFLPELGGAKGAVRLTAPTYSDLAVEDIDIELGRQAELLINATGRIDKIPLSGLPVTGIDLQLSATAAHTKHITPLLDFPLPDLGPVTLTAHFSGSQSESDLTGISLEAGHKDSFLLSSEGNCSFTDFSSDSFIDKVNLTADFFGSAAALNPMVPYDLSNIARLKGHAKINAKGKNGVFDGKLHIGDTEIASHLTVIFGNDRPYIEGEISTPVFHADDFGLRHHTDDQTGTPLTEKQAQVKDNKEEPFFSRVPLDFSFLHATDLSLDVVVRTFENRKPRLENDADIKIFLQNGRLTIDPASFIFEGGVLDTNLFVDGNTDPPQMNLDVNAENVDLGLIVSLLQKEVAISGNFHLYGDFSSSGSSPHEIAANLMGDMEMVLDGAKVPRHLTDLLAVDLLGWSFSKAIQKENLAEITCGIIDVNAENGILTSDSLIVDAPRIQITGGGMIDLGAETIDVAIYPKKKKKFWSMVTPVHVKGKLGEPTVTAIPVKSAGIMAGGMLIAPQFFLPAVGINYLWEMMTGDKEEKDENLCLEKLKKMKGVLGN